MARFLGDNAPDEDQPPAGFDVEIVAGPAGELIIRTLDADTDQTVAALVIEPGLEVNIGRQIVEHADGPLVPFVTVHDRPANLLGIHAITLIPADHLHESIDHP